MRLLFIINTTGQAHTWKNVMSELGRRGHTIKILAREYGQAHEILRAAGFSFEAFQPIGSGRRRMMNAPRHFQTCYEFSKGFNPSIILGFGIDAAVTAARLRTRSIVFIDNDHTPFQNNLTRLLGSTIITPDCFIGDLGRKHIRIKGYKELAYLHPDNFHADEKILTELKVGKKEDYIILRFNNFDAVHDIGEKGFSVADQIKLVREMEQQVRVFVSPEGELPRTLDRYRLDIAPERFHDAIYYAKLVITDTGTTTTEAALLGTPVIMCRHYNSRKMGNFEDLRRHELLFYCDDADSSILKATELLGNRFLKDEASAKRARLIQGKIDVGDYLVDFIENYPAGNFKYGAAVV
jgi:uncharacterized protein